MGIVHRAPLRPTGPRASSGGRVAGQNLCLGQHVAVPRPLVRALVERGPLGAERVLEELEDRPVRRQVLRELREACDVLEDLSA